MLNLINITTNIGWCPFNITMDKETDHRVCIALFPDIVTTDASTSTNLCQQMLNDSTAKVPTLNSKFMKTKITNESCYSFF